MIFLFRLIRFLFTCDPADIIEEILKSSKYLEKKPSQNTTTKVLPPMEDSLVMQELNKISTTGLKWDSSDCAAAMVDRWTVGLTDDFRRWVKPQDEDVRNLIQSSGLSRVSRFGVASNDLRIAAEAALMNTQLQSASGYIHKAVFATADGAAALQASILGAPVVLVLTHPTQNRAGGAYLGAIWTNPTLDAPEQVVWLDFPTLEALSTRASFKRAVLPDQLTSSGQAICLVFNDAEQALGRKWLKTLFLMPSSLLRAVENSSKDARRYDIRDGFSPFSNELKYGTRMSVSASLLQLLQVGHLALVVDDDPSIPVEDQLTALCQVGAVKNVVGFSSSNAKAFPNAKRESRWDDTNLMTLFSIDECVKLSDSYHHRFMLVKAAGLY